MAGNYKVTPEQVSDAANTVTAKAGDIKEQLDGLRTYIQNLEDWWQGIAHNAFDTLMAEYNVLANMLHESLVDIGSGLTGTYVNYTESEQSNLKNLEQLEQSLPLGNLN